MDHICFVPGCYNVGDPCWYPEDPEPWYLCIIHMVEQGYCWCCGEKLPRDSERKLCSNCYDPEVSDEPFENVPDLYDDGPIVTMKGCVVDLPIEPA